MHIIKYYLELYIHISHNICFSVSYAKFYFYALQNSLHILVAIHSLKKQEIDFRTIHTKFYEALVYSVLSWAFFSSKAILIP